jgi:hypothetical protein
VLSGFLLVRSPGECLAIWSNLAGEHYALCPLIPRP